MPLLHYQKHSRLGHPELDLHDRGCSITKIQLSSPDEAKVNCVTARSKICHVNSSNCIESYIHRYVEIQINWLKTITSSIISPCLTGWQMIVLGSACLCHLSCMLMTGIEKYLLWKSRCHGFPSPSHISHS